MVDQIDVDKLKNEAVSAIDLLFGDDEDSFGDDYEVSEITSKAEQYQELEQDDSLDEDQIDDTLLEEEFLEEVTQQEETLSVEDDFTESLSMEMEQETTQTDLPQEGPDLEKVPTETINTQHLVKETDVNFETLKEDLLTIDWEYSDERINSFLANLDELLNIHTDKYSQALLKMIRSVIRYLDKAREKAYPETMVVLPGIIKILQEIHSDNPNTATIPSKVKGSYQELLALRNSIAQYNQYVRKEGKPEPQKAPADKQETRGSGISPDVLSVIKNLEQRLIRLEDENKDLRSAIASLEQKTIQSAAPVAALNLDETHPEPSKDMEEPSFSIFEQEEPNNPLASPDSSPAPVVPLTDDTPEDEPPISSLIEDISADEITFEEPEKINLSDISFDQTEKTEPAQEISFDQSPAMDSDSINLDITPDDTEGEPETLQAGDIEYEEVETLGAGDIQYGDSPDEISFETADVTQEVTEEFEYQPEVLDEPQEEPSIAFEEVPAASKSLASQDDDIEYKTDIDESIPPIEELDDEKNHVQCCMLDDEIIAFPEKIINNVYKLPFKLSRGIYDEQIIPLKKLSSGLFSRLSKNMKGSLTKKSNSELKKMSARVKLLKEDTVDYSYALLCSCEGQDDLILIPVSDNLDNTVEEVIEFKELDNSFSETVVNIEDLGTIPLIDPCE